MLPVSIEIRCHESGTLGYTFTRYERFPADGMGHLFRRQVRASYFEFGLVNLLFDRGPRNNSERSCQTAENDSHSAEAYRDGRVAGTQIQAIDLDISMRLNSSVSVVNGKTGPAGSSWIRFPNLYISLTAMKVDARIGLHMNSGRISVQTIEWHIRMHAGSQAFDLPKDRVLVVDGAVPHDVEAPCRQRFSADCGASRRDSGEEISAHGHKQRVDAITFVIDTSTYDSLHPKVG